MPLLYVFFALCAKVHDLIYLPVCLRLMFIANWFVYIIHKWAAILGNLISIALNWFQYLVALVLAPTFRSTSLRCTQMVLQYTMRSTIQLILVIAKGNY